MARTGAFYSVAGSLAMIHQPRSDVLCRFRTSPQLASWKLLATFSCSSGVRSANEAASRSAADLVLRAFSFAPFAPLIRSHTLRISSAVIATRFFFKSGYLPKWGSKFAHSHVR
jgi:hypothetical protein